MIVDFVQDPDAPFGTGNFRDDSGRIMYVADPDTASDFVKTLPGSASRGGGGGEAPPTTGTDNPARVEPPASNAQRYQDAARGLAGAPPVAKGAGAALVERQAAVDAEIKTPAAPAAPAPPEARAGLGPYDTSLSPDEESAFQAWKQKYAPNDSGVDYDLRGAFRAGLTPGADGHWPDTFKKPNHPTFSVESKYASAAPDKAGSWRNGQYVPPGGRGAELVQRHENAVNALAGVDKRLQKRPLPSPAPVSTNGLPPFSTTRGESVNVEEGRPIENVVEQLSEEERVGEAGDVKIGQAYDARIAASDASYGKRQAAVNQNSETQRKRMNEARTERLKAEAEQKRLNEALKENDSKLDPERTMRNMSTGKTIAMIFLAALNGGFGAVIGKKDNDVINVMNRAVDQDIDRQKQEIASGRIRIGNLISKFMNEGHDAKTAELLARDKLDANLAAYADLEAQRVGASADLRAQKDALLQQRLEARTLRRGEALKESEDKVSRARRAEESYQAPQLTPQALLATVQLQNAQTEQANTAPVQAAVGHPVSPDEAKEIRTDSQDYGKRLAAIAGFRNTLKTLARELGLKPKPNEKGFQGKADPGERPLGVPVNKQARQIDRMYTLLQRADVMGMVREPSARLQDRFGEITERPFWDSDIPTQLNDLNDWANQAEAELQNGFSKDAVNYYNEHGKASAAKPPPKPPGRDEKAAEADRNTPGENSGTAPSPKTPGRPKSAAPGGAEVY